MPGFTPIQVPLINGVAYSFAHIELQIAGLSFTGGFKSIKYERTREREMLYSNSPDPVAQTLGQNKYTCSAVLYLAWWYALKATVQQTLGLGYGDQAFTVNVNYNAPGFFDPFMDSIQGCHFDSTKADQSAGITALEREIDFKPLKIYFDQDDDLAVPLQAAAQ